MGFTRPLHRVESVAPLWHHELQALGASPDGVIGPGTSIGAGDAGAGRLSLGQFELEALGLENPVVIDDEEAADVALTERRARSLDEAVAYALDGDVRG